MATRDGARALGWFDDIGSIEVGKKADLIGIDVLGPENRVAAPALDAKSLDPEAFASSVVYSSGRSHLRWTLVDGRPVYEKGRVPTVPVQRLLERVHRAQLSIARAIR
jgi:5-methylthioadenosine/S-adenosylhomocysteine deaminase